jgi:hypothetical protein
MELYNVKPMMILDSQFCRFQQVYSVAHSLFDPCACYSTSMEEECTENGKGHRKLMKAFSFSL